MNKLEQGQISGKQLTFLIASFLLGSILVISPGSRAGNDAWIASILGFGEGLIFAFLYIMLAGRYPGKTLIEINDAVFGRILGKFFSLCYLWYFFQLGSLVLRNFGDFFVTIIFPETPMVVLLIMLTLICASAARNGIEVISRCSLVLLPLVIITGLITFIFLLPEMKLDKLLPLFQTPPLRLLECGHIIATFPYGETITFLMVLAFLQKPKQGKASFLTGFVITFLFMLMAVVRNIATLGITTTIDLYPSYEAVRLVSIAEVITRIEILVAANFLFMGFLKISVLYYATALGLAQLLKLKSYLPLILPLGALMISFSILQFESNDENIFFATRIYPYYSLPFELFLPGLTLLTSLLRRQKTKEAKQ